MDDKVKPQNGSQSTERQTNAAKQAPHDHPSQSGTPLFLIGAGIALFGLTRRSSRGTVLAVVGIAVAVTGVKSRNGEGARETHVHRVVTINRPRHEVYERWRHLEELPRDMKNLQAVEKTDDRHSHWSAKGPLGRIVEWDAETTRQEQDSTISWRSLPGAAVPNHGSVRFSDAPKGRGTQLNLTLSCHIPGGQIGVAVARLTGRHPGPQVESDLRRFKAILEAGEAPTTHDQPAGERSSIGRLSNAWAGAR